MPIDRGIIEQQLDALGESSRWWERREMRDLPAVLHAEEHILAISRGKLARLRWLRRPWLMVVTDRRLLCLRSGAGSSWRQVEINAAHITRVALRVGPFHGRVLIVAGGEKYRLLVPRDDAYRMFSALSGIASPAKQAATGFAPTRMVRRMMDHVLALPAAALNPLPPAEPPPPPDTTDLRQRLDTLENEVHELRQQVAFLEQLLQQRHDVSSAADVYAPGGRIGS